MIVDTDVMIWYFRGNDKAKRQIDNIGTLYISAVTYMELVQGMRNSQELRALKKFLGSRSAKIIQIDDSISSRAMYLVEKYYLSHSLQLADALIAATGITHAMKIFTGNIKDYKFIHSLDLKKFNSK